MEQNNLKTFLSARYLLQLALVYSLYFLAGWIGIRFAGMGEGSLTLIWLPSGVGLASCLVFGKKIWPAIWLGSFSANSPYLYDTLAQWPLLKAAFYGGAAATINTCIQSLFAYILYQRHIGDRHFNSKRTILEFIFRVALIPSSLNIILLLILYYTGGFLTADLADPDYSLLTTWLSGVLGDFHGYFIVAPLVITWYFVDKTAFAYSKNIALALLVIFVFAVLMIASIFWFSQGIYLLAALGVLITLKFGAKGTSLFMLTLSLCLTFATAAHIGPFVLESDWSSFVTLLLFIFGIGVPIYLIVGESNEKSQLLDSLEDLVDVRTRELTIAKDEAEKAYRDKSRFITNASHDLRQPLHALNLHLEIAKRLAENKNQYDLSSVDESVKILNSLFNEILDISKLDAGVLEVNISSFQLQSIMDSLEREFFNDARTKGLQLSIRKTDARINGDQILLLRILQNLVSNAIRYSDKGTVSIYCQNHAGNLQIIVEDTGKGIPPDEQINIFREFYQVNNKPRDRQKGMGLGLSIVKRLCDLLQYDIEMDSLLEQGTVFKINIPLEKTTQDNAESNKPLVLNDLSGAAILVLENDRDILEATAKLLQSWNCAALTASSYEGARAILDKEEIDLILCDFSLEETMNGAEVTMALASDYKADIPAIIISGETSGETLEKIKSSGYQYLSKPVTPELLHTSISRILAEKL